jgi:hypothetical protein
MCVNTLLLSRLVYGLINKFKPAESQIDKTHGKLEPRHVLGRDASIKKQRAKRHDVKPETIVSASSIQLTMTIRSCLMATGRKGGLGVGRLLVL